MSDNMAQRVAETWLKTAYEGDHFAFDEDNDVFAARRPVRRKGKIYNPSYGNTSNKKKPPEGLNEDEQAEFAGSKKYNKRRYKWAPKQKTKCWYLKRPDLMKSHWAEWKQNKQKDGESINRKDWYKDFNKDTADQRANSLCYHKDEDAPGRHSDLQSMPSVTKGENPRAPDKQQYNRMYWKKRVKRTGKPKGRKKKTAYEVGYEHDRVAKEHYPWEDCIKDQTEKYDSEDMAKRICGKIRARSQGLGQYK